MAVWKAIAVSIVVGSCLAGCGLFAEDYEEISKRWAGTRQKALQCEQTGDYAKAETLYGQAIKDAETMKLNLSPLVVSLEDLARLKYLQGNLEQAESLYKRAYEVSMARAKGGDKETTLKSYNREETLRALQGIADINRDRGNYEAAEKYYKQVLKYVENVSESYRTSFLANYADYLDKVGRTDEALKAREDAQEMSRLFEHHTSAGFQREKNTRWGRSLDQAEWLCQGERFADAAQEFAAALDEAGQSDPQSAQMAETIDVINKMKWPPANRAKCLALWKKALAIEVKGGETDQYGEHLGMFARILLNWGERAAAAEYAAKSLAVLESTHGRSHLPAVLETLAGTTDDKAKRMQLLEKAYNLAIEDKRADAALRLAAPLAELYEKDKRNADAEKTYLKCFRVTEDNMEPGDRSITSLRERYQAFKERAKQ